MRSFVWLVWVFLAVGLQAQTKLPWDVAALAKPPNWRPSTQFSEPGVQAIEFDGLPFKGKPTRVFAWLAIPKDEAKLPAMVLVHGGGGTAHARWARLWADRGYVAIAMDLCGKFGGDSPQATRTEFSGPAGWDASYDQVDWPTEDQWPYHAVADAVLAHSLVRSLPQVDPNRVGLTGISWGGYLTCIIAGVDDRFRLAAPVYGCGFLRDGSAWSPRYEMMGPEKSGKWLAQWDPSVYLPRAKVPMLWITGDVDFAYPLDSVQKSYRLATGPRTLSIIHGMNHSHPAGETPEEIHAFVDSILKDGTPLARCTAQKLDGRKLTATFEAKSKLATAQVIFTKDKGPWQKRKWAVQPASLAAATGTASAEIPDGATVAYLNVIDERKLISSCEHVELP